MEEKPKRQRSRLYQFRLVFFVIAGMVASGTVAWFSRPASATIGDRLEAIFTAWVSIVLGGWLLVHVVTQFLRDKAEAEQRNERD